MCRVDDLQMKYPGFSRPMIIRKDVQVHGLRDTGKLDKLGRWVRMTGVGTYATYDHDITLKEWVARHPGRLKPGQVLRPGQFVLRNGFEVKKSIYTQSDLEVREEDAGRYGLYQGDERVEEVYHMPPQAADDVEEYSTSSGTLASNFVTWKSKYCFFIAPVRHCEYFPLGVACKFCNFNPTQDDARSIGLQRSTTINIEETLEAYRQHASQVRVIEGRFEMGAFTKNEIESRTYTNFIESIAKSTPYKPNFLVLTQPMYRNQMQRLKDAGLECMSFQMEIWDPVLFAEVVPGKAKYHGRDRFLGAFQDAVDIFGAGNVGCVFVGGISMFAPSGHKTWQDARDSMIEGITWLAKHGVFSQVEELRLPPGAAYASEENRRRYPPTEYYLDVFHAEHQALKECGMYEKLNRLMWCPLCIGHDCIEMAAGELTGGLGNWAAPVVPREANWHLDWEETFASLTKRR